MLVARARGAPAEAFMRLNQGRLVSSWFGRASKAKAPHAPASTPFFSAACPRHLVAAPAPTSREQHTDSPCVWPIASSLHLGAALLAVPCQPSTCPALLPLQLARRLGKGSSGASCRRNPLHAHLFTGPPMEPSEARQASPSCRPAPALPGHHHQPPKHGRLHQLRRIGSIGAQALRQGLGQQPRRLASGPAASSPHACAGAGAGGAVDLVMVHTLAAFGTPTAVTLAHPGPRARLLHCLPQQHRAAELGRIRWRSRR